MTSNQGASGSPRHSHDSSDGVFQTASGTNEGTAAGSDARPTPGYRSTDSLLLLPGGDQVSLQNSKMKILEMARQSPVDEPQDNREQTVLIQQTRSKSRSRSIRSEQDLADRQEHVERSEVDEGRNSEKVLVGIRKKTTPEKGGVRRTPTMLSVAMDDDGSLQLTDGSEGSAASIRSEVEETGSVRTERIVISPTQGQRMKVKFKGRSKASPGKIDRRSRSLSPKEATEARRSDSESKRRGRGRKRAEEQPSTGEEDSQQPFMSPTTRVLSASDLSSQEYQMITPTSVIVITRRGDILSDQKRKQADGTEGEDSAPKEEDRSSRTSRSRKSRERSGSDRSSRGARDEDNRAPDRDRGKRERGPGRDSGPDRDRGSDRGRGSDRDRKPKDRDSSRNRRSDGGRSNRNRGDRDREDRDREESDRGGRDRGGKNRGRRDRDERDRGGRDRGGRDQDEGDRDERDRGGRDRGRSDRGGRDQGRRDRGGRDRSERGRGERSRGGRDRGDTDRSPDNDRDRGSDRNRRRNKDRAPDQRSDRQEDDSGKTLVPFSCSVSDKRTVGTDTTRRKKRTPKKEVAPKPSFNVSPIPAEAYATGARQSSFSWSVVDMAARAKASAPPPAPEDQESAADNADDADETNTKRRVRRKSSSKRRTKSVPGELPRVVIRTYKEQPYIPYRCPHHNYPGPENEYMDDTTDDLQLPLLQWSRRPPSRMTAAPRQAIRRRDFARMGDTVPWLRPVRRRAVYPTRADVVPWAPRSDTSIEDVGLGVMEVSTLLPAELQPCRSTEVVRKNYPKVVGESVRRRSVYPTRTEQVPWAPPSDTSIEDVGLGVREMSTVVPSDLQPSKSMEVRRSSYPKTEEAARRESLYPTRVKDVPWAPPSDTSIEDVGLGVREVSTVVPAELLPSRSNEGRRSNYPEKDPEEKPRRHVYPTRSKETPWASPSDTSIRDVGLGVKEVSTVAPVILQPSKSTEGSWPPSGGSRSSNYTRPDMKAESRMRSAYPSRSQVQWALPLDADLAQETTAAQVTLQASKSTEGSWPPPSRSRRNNYAEMEEESEVRPTKRDFYPTGPEERLRTPSSQTKFRDTGLGGNEMNTEAPEMRSREVRSNLDPPVWLQSPTESKTVDGTASTVHMEEMTVHRTKTKDIIVSPSRVFEPTADLDRPGAQLSQDQPLDKPKYRVRITARSLTSKPQRNEQNMQDIGDSPFRRKKRTRRTVLETQDTTAFRGLPRAGYGRLGLYPVQVRHDYQVKGGSGKQKQSEDSMPTSAVARLQTPMKSLSLDAQCNREDQEVYVYEEMSVGTTTVKVQKLPTLPKPTGASGSCPFPAAVTRDPHDFHGTGHSRLRDRQYVSSGTSFDLKSRGSDLLIEPSVGRMPRLHSVVMSTKTVVYPSLALLAIAMIVGIAAVFQSRSPKEQAFVAVRNHSAYNGSSTAHDSSKVEDACTMLCQREGAYLDGLISWELDPCDDFYRFVCKQWRSTVSNAHEEGTSVHGDLVHSLESGVLALLQDSHYPKELARAKHVFEECTNVRQLDVEGWSHMLELLRLVGLDELPYATTPANVSVWKTAATVLRTSGTETLLSVRTVAHPSKKGETIIAIGTPALLSPNPRNSVETIRFYNEAAYGALTALRKQRHNASALSVSVANFAARLEALASNDASRYQLVTLEAGRDVSVFATEVFDAGASPLFAGEGTDVLLTSPDYFDELSSLVGISGAYVVLNYIGVKLMVEMAAFAPSAGSSLVDALAHHLYGRPRSTLPRWKLCIRTTERAAPPLFLRAAQLVYNNSLSTRSVRRHVKDLVAHLALSLDNLAVLDDETRLRARKLLNRTRVALFRPNWLSNKRKLEAYVRDFPEGAKGLGLHSFYTLRGHSFARALREDPGDSWLGSAFDADCRTEGSTLYVPALIFNLSAAGYEGVEKYQLPRAGTAIVRCLLRMILNAVRVGPVDGRRNRRRPDFSRSLLRSSKLCFEKYGLVGTDAAFLIEATAAIGPVLDLFVSQRDNATRFPGVRKLDATHLFFVYYALGSCAEESTVAKNSRTVQLVNASLWNNRAFQSAFQCPVGTRMNPVEKCALWLEGR